LQGFHDGWTAGISDSQIEELPADCLLADKGYDTNVFSLTLWMDHV
jgi:hypothetical protein